MKNQRKRAVDAFRNGAWKDLENILNEAQNPVPYGTGDGSINEAEWNAMRTIIRVNRDLHEACRVAITVWRLRPTELPSEQ